MSSRILSRLHRSMAQILNGLSTNLDDLREFKNAIAHVSPHIYHGVIEILHENHVIEFLTRSLSLTGDLDTGERTDIILQLYDRLATSNHSNARSAIAEGGNFEELTKILLLTENVNVLNRVLKVLRDVSTCLSITAQDKSAALTHLHMFMEQYVMARLLMLMEKSGLAHRASARTFHTCCIILSLLTSHGAPPPYHAVARFLPLLRTVLHKPLLVGGPCHARNVRLASFVGVIGVFGTVTTDSADTTDVADSDDDSADSDSSDSSDDCDSDNNSGSDSNIDDTDSVSRAVGNAVNSTDDSAADADARLADITAFALGDGLDEVLRDLPDDVPQRHHVEVTHLRVLLLCTAALDSATLERAFTAPRLDAFAEFFNSANWDVDTLAPASGIVTRLMEVFPSFRNKMIAQNGLVALMDHYSFNIYFTDVQPAGERLICLLLSTASASDATCLAQLLVNGGAVRFCARALKAPTQWRPDSRARFGPPKPDSAAVLRQVRMLRQMLAVGASALGDAQAAPAATAQQNNVATAFLAVEGLATLELLHTAEFMQKNEQALLELAQISSALLASTSVAHSADA